jgi:osmotically-inducible protein OsmY
MRQRARGRLLLLLGLAACGCSQDADRLTRVCQKTANKFDGVTSSIRTKLQTGWSPVHAVIDASGLDSHVAMRLHWDKDLAGADIKVVSFAPGVIHLRGRVADLTQHRRAIDLAQSTTGVITVIDELATGG